MSNLTDQLAAALRPYLEHTYELRDTCLAAQEHNARIRKARAALAAYDAQRAAGLTSDASAEDTSRLNYLALNPRRAEIIVDGEVRPCIFWGISSAPEHTLREAIDAARAQL